jgi:hypothetical protein
MSALPPKADIQRRGNDGTVSESHSRYAGISPEVRKWGRYLIFDWIGLGKGNRCAQVYLAPLARYRRKNGGALMGKPMDQVKAFATSNALHYLRQLIGIVGRYGTVDKEFTALMDQLIAAYNEAKR